MLHDSFSANTNSPLAQALALFKDQPEVVGIDIGLLPIAHGDFSVGLRIHLATPADVIRLHQKRTIPETINGVRLMLVPMPYNALASQPSDIIQPRAKYSLKAGGMGQLLMQVLETQSPLGGRNLSLNAHSGRHGQIITFCSAHAAQQFILALDDLQNDIVATPTAPAPILCYYNGHFSGSENFEINVINGSVKKNGRRFSVDGCGLYAHQSEREERFIEGVRLTPTL